MSAAWTVVKVGGHVIDDAAALDRFLHRFAALEGPKLMVHGGGRLASSTARAMGLEPRMVEGRRITDADTLRVVVMSYAGWIGKDIAARLNAMGCRALSLCGADAGLVRTVRRPPHPIDFGYVGDAHPAGVDAARLEQLHAAGLVPVLAPITADASGQLLNTNADTLAATVAAALATKAEVHLYLAFEKEGVLDAHGQVIPALDREAMETLVAAGVVKDGMRPKLDAGFMALQHGVRSVQVGSAEALAEVFQGGCIATRLQDHLSDHARP